MDAEPSGVDRSQIEEYVGLTPQERLERAVAWARFIAELESAPVTRTRVD